ncbi:MAG: hypothetical protein MZW92_19950 [Comamonadaceae bacterium]|nr:hypothetical protein [Comamonadaceae bacterium]
MQNLQTDAGAVAPALPLQTRFIPEVTTAHAGQRAGFRWRSAEIRHRRLPRVDSSRRRVQPSSSSALHHPADRFGAKAA